MLQQGQNNKSNTITTTMKFTCHLRIQQVYFITFLYVSWWVISFLIHNKMVLQIKSYTHNLFYFICSITHHIFSSQLFKSIRFVVSLFWRQSFPTWEKVRDKIVKPVLAVAFQNFVKDILSSFNLLLSPIYNLKTTLINQCSL